MKTLLSLILLFLISTVANAEIVELAKYQDGFGRERTVKVVLKGDQPSAVIIPCEKDDGSEGFVYQPINYLFAVESYLKEIHEKYLEWTQTAIDNGVKEYEKKFGASGYLYGFLWYNPDRRYGSSELNAVWKYSQDMNIVEATAKVVDNNGSYEIANFNLTFSCSKDIDMLLESISDSNIKSHTPVTTDNLFR